MFYCYRCEKYTIHKKTKEGKKGEADKYTCIVCEMRKEDRDG